jgi:hypothetical protein
MTKLPKMMVMQEPFCDAAFVMLAAFYFVMFLSEEERNVDGSAQGSAVGN